MSKLDRTIRRNYVDALIAYVHAINQDKERACRMYWLGHIQALQAFMHRNTQQDIMRVLIRVRD